MNDEIAKKIESLFNQARQLDQKNRLEEALVIYREILRIFPYHVSALNNAGAIFAQLYSDFKSALECYNAALRTNSKNIESIIGKGSVMARLENPDDAVLYYKKALEFNSQSIDALRGLATAFLLLNQIDDSFDQLELILQQNPDDVDALLNKGVFLAKKGQYDDAVNTTKKILNIQPNHKMAMDNISYFVYLRSQEKSYE